MFLARGVISVSGLVVLQPGGCVKQIRKNVFFTFFDVFLFPTRFLFFKNVRKVQSGKQINKMHFQNNSNEIGLWFICRIELQALAGIWNSMGS